MSREGKFTGLEVMAQSAREEIYKKRELCGDLWKLPCVFSRVGIYIRPKQEPHERIGRNSAEWSHGAVERACSHRTRKSPGTWGTAESTQKGLALAFIKIHRFFPLIDRG